MSRAIHAIVFAVLSCAPCACSLSPPPEYPADRLRFDETLVGMWEPAEAKDEDEKVQFEIKPREVDLLNGRVDSTVFQLSGRPAPQRAKVYKVIVSSNDGRPLEFDAFLFEAGGQRLCGLQVCEKQLADSGLLGVVLPLH